MASVSSWTPSPTAPKSRTFKLACPAAKTAECAMITTAAAIKILISVPLESLNLAK
jgi:hypothetical protein